MTEQPTQVEALAACPFCGGDDFEIGKGDSYWVVCAGCGAEGPWHDSDGSKEAAIASWNRRATPIQDAEVERLKAAIERIGWHDLTSREARDIARAALSAGERK